MNSKRQNNTLQAFWYGMGSLSSLALSIVSAAILSRYFDKNEYGTYKQILYVYNTLLVIFTAGLPRVFSYFLPRYSLEEGKNIVQKITRILFYSGVLFSVFLFSFSGIISRLLNNPELTIGLRYFSVVPMLLLPTLGIEGIFTSYGKSLYIAVYNIATRMLMLLFIVLPVILFHGTYLYAIYGWIVVSVITLIAAYFFKGIPYRGIKDKPADLTLKQIFNYSLPLVGASLAGIALRSADQFFISRYFGTSVFADYSNGFIQLPFVGMITGAASAVIMPRFSEMIANNETQRIIEIWRSSLIKSATLIYPMVMFFIFHANLVVVLIYSEIYQTSVIYFDISLLINFFNIIIFVPMILSLGKTKFYFIVHAVFAIAVWVGEFLIVKFIHSPIVIAAFSAFISVMIISVFLIKISALMKVPFIQLFPVKVLFSLILQSSLILLIIKVLQNFIWNDINKLTLLLINATFFTVVLLLTSKLFNINYFSIISPIIRKQYKNDM